MDGGSRFEEGGWNSACISGAHGQCPSGSAHHYLSPKAKLGLLVGPMQDRLEAHHTINSFSDLRGVELERRQRDLRARLGTCREDGRSRIFTSHRADLRVPGLWIFVPEWRSRS